ncbi:MAG TPA: aminopeptidase N [Gammaproteobacteria bacterium]|nr:aminopeptidase N [Gammaproteobacteria bacterium]
MSDLVNDTAASTPRTIFLKDYRPPAWLVDSVELRFELDPDATRVSSRLQVRRNPAAVDGDEALFLNGQKLELEGVCVDGEPLGESDYRLDDEGLLIEGLADRALVEIDTLIHPRDNTALEGLYLSSGMFCTQCEAEGFRRITFYPDRPDVMARFSTTIVAERESYPVLLSNGNPVEHGELEDGRHWARWEDPFPKPSYLFALVAGDLHCQEDRFTTRSGREVTLKAFVEHANRDKCDHALASLKQAMQWDEETFGREYDLDIFMIVAVDDFNMGAMENKGLNIFNSSCVLASPETATDSDYYHIQSIIGHEYFHNWSGNRVTCRDWFQLSLKEGFTVFRDQEFSADLNSRPVKRIADVNVLRSHQFAQDASPMAHPVRPDSYIEISNFYTVTVYNKGAELVRMIRNLLGADGFRKGCDLYFERHDGQAVTTDDFVAAMEDATGIDLGQFRRWYSQAGTPVIRVSEDYDPGARRYRLTLEQSCPPTPGQEHKAPFHIPVETALLDSRGRPMRLRLDGEPQAGGTHRMLELREARQHFDFLDVEEKPLPSLLRGFSAPVKLEIERTPEQLAFLFAHDPDPFNRWDAGQTLATHTLLGLVEDVQLGKPLRLENALVDAFERTLAHPQLDPALIAQALQLPSESWLADQCDTVDVDAIHAAREFMRKKLAEELYPTLLQRYRQYDVDEPYRFDAESMGQRSLKNLCLSYLLETIRGEARNLCFTQLEKAHNMTDTLAALSSLAQFDWPETEDYLQRFYQRWQHDPQVVDKWFAIQAGSRLPRTLQRVEALMQHPAFRLSNPNKVRALIGRFCHGNPVRFHAASGEGYRFLADRVLELDAINPQIAARLVSALSRWQRFDRLRQDLMRRQLERILNTPDISRDVFEIVSKSLAPKD